MARPKGTPKTGGRQKGSPNKITATIKTAMSEFMEANWHQMQQCFDELTDPKDKLTLLLKIAEFVIPKQRAVDNNIMLEQKLDSLSDNQIEGLIDLIIEQSDEQ